MSTKIGAHRNYYLIDNSAAGGERIEVETWTCTHCQGQVVPSPVRTREREVCFKCMRVVCDRCKAIAENFGCQPFAMIAESVLAGTYQEDPQFPGLLLPSKR